MSIGKVVWRVMATTWRSKRQRLTQFLLARHDRPSNLIAGPVAMLV
jgi:hypothetical protein